MAFKSDQDISKYIVSLTKRSRLLSIVAIFGASICIWILAILIFFWVIQTPSDFGTISFLRATALRSLPLVGGIFFSWIATLIIEYFLKRKRPFQKRRFKPLIKMPFITPSFPSAHATIAFSLATSAMVFNLNLVSLSFLVLAIFIALSRVAVGVHYLSDIIAGALIGSMVTLGFLSLF